MTSGVVAVTGPHGRLGSALVRELTRRDIPAASWARPEYDLDDPASAAAFVVRDGPRLVLHAAAWTDVDGCARDPTLASRRNGEATGELARACAAAGARLVVVSTNEVFDGRRTDGRGYVETDDAAPGSPYGASKLLGERLAEDAFASAGRREDLWIARTAWLFGPPGNDFPARILAVAARLPPGEPLRVVRDETGSPTYAPDLAAALLDLVDQSPAGTYHLVNRGTASRYDWAETILDACQPDHAPLRAIAASDFVRASTPPAFAVLDASRAAAAGIRLRDWRVAFADYVPLLCPG